MKKPDKRKPLTVDELFTHPMYHILKPDKTVVGATMEEYVRWEKENGPDARKIERTAFTDGTEVSTVFLMIEHPGGMFFETMIFSPDGADRGQTRYRTWAEARKGHFEAVAILRANGLKLCTELAKEFMKDLKNV